MRVVFLGKKGKCISPITLIKYAILDRDTDKDRATLSVYNSPQSSHCSSSSSSIQITADVNGILVCVLYMSCVCLFVYVCLFAACREPKVSELVRQRILPPQTPSRYVYQLFYITSLIISIKCLTHQSTV